MRGRRMRRGEKRGKKEARERQEYVIQLNTVMGEFGAAG